MPLDFTFRNHREISRGASQIDKREKQLHHYLNKTIVLERLVDQRKRAWVYLSLPPTRQDLTQGQ